MDFLGKESFLCSVLAGLSGREEAGGLSIPVLPREPCRAMAQGQHRQRQHEMAGSTCVEPGHDD
jgi:hypothetical protein